MGGGRQGRRPATSWWDCRSHMNSEMAVAAGDCGFGLKCERGKDELWTANNERQTATLRRRRLRATATARGWLTICFLPFFIFVSCGFPKSANLVYGTGFRGFDIY